MAAPNPRIADHDDRQRQGVIPAYGRGWIADRGKAAKAARNPAATAVREPSGGLVAHALVDIDRKASAATLGGDGASSLPAGGRA